MASIVIYYSRRGENYFGGQIKNIQEGNAEHIAKVIQSMTNSDIYEIKPIKDYSADYTECTKEAMAELKAQARPEYQNPLPSLANYDTIYLCYPCWWGTYPRVVATFLEDYDFNGKIIKPMSTHEGSNMGSSEQELKRTLPKAIIKPGLAILGSKAHSSDKEIQRWVKE